MPGSRVTDWMAWGVVDSLKWFRWDRGTRKGSWGCNVDCFGHREKDTKAYDVWWEYPLAMTFLSTNPVVNDDCHLRAHTQAYLSFNRSISHFILALHLVFSLLLHFLF